MKAFTVLDIKHDGQLDEAEIKHGLIKYLGQVSKKAEQISKDFMSKIDIDSSKTISFSGKKIIIKNLFSQLLI
jgi:Ca2+-binding EF-hand superfamily protein